MERERKRHPQMLVHLAPTPTVRWYHRPIDVAAAELDVDVAG